MLELEKTKFYYLEISDKKFVFTNYQEATDKIKNIIRNINEEINEDNIALYEVNIEADPWEIQETSWMMFALELLREE